MNKIIYTKKWKLTVNIDKTKIVIFRNGGLVKDEEKCLYDDVQKDIVNKFTYLGIVLNFNGKFAVFLL